MHDSPRSTGRETMMLAALTRALASYVTDGDISQTFAELLDLLLTATDSEYGFIGEVRYDNAGEPYLRTHAVTNIAWNEESRAFYDQNALAGLEFRSLETLFGHVLSSGEPVLANRPVDDPRRGGTPAGHPPLDSYLGLPFSFRDRMIGMVSVANRPGGYDEEIITLLEPLLNTCAQLVNAVRMERERQLAREREARMRQTLEEAYRMESLGRLAGCVAHDFNNLLTIISANCDLIGAQMQADDPIRTDIDSIAHAAQRATTLTRQLLVFARQDQLPSHDARFGEGMKNGLQLLQRILGSNIELRAELHDEPRFVRMDPTQLEQMIVNLGVNARDAMPDGGVLTIHTEAIRLDDHDAVRLTVADTGKGIPERDLPRLFDPFFTTKPVGQGTGLGLAMCYGAISRAGGYIRAENAPTGGARFVAEIPTHDSSTYDELLEAKDEALRGNGQHVLVVEDERSIRSIVERTLRGAGYVVTALGDSEEAAERLASTDVDQYDLLLTDMLMPGRTGRELAELARGRIRRVLFMSGYLGENAELPSDGPLLVKPFTPRNLLQRLHELFAD